MSPTPTADPAKAKKFWRNAGWYLLCLAVLAVLLYPVIWLLSASVKSGPEIASNLSLIPELFSPENFTVALDGAAGISFGTLLGNSVMVSVGAVIGNVFSCTLAAYAFARLRFRGQNILFALMIATIMLPVHVVLIPQYSIFQQLGLVGTLWPLILPKVLATEGFFVFLIVQFVRGLPRELDEAATIDGCGPYRTFWSIILPLLKPALVTTTIFSFIWSWNDFFSQLIYLLNPETFTLQLGLRMFMDQTSASSFGPMFAMSVLTLVPVFLFFLFFQRYLVEGVATSGLKG
ncbi:MAG: carbohydrate ABC transporter permease [Leucobacter sp.]